MKRSHAPIFWLMFGAGGMLAALFGPALVFLTGIAVPLGWLHPSPLRGYAQALALMHSVPGKGAALIVIALFAWHAAHRILHSLHDLGVHAGLAAKLACYGSATALTLVLLSSLLWLGF